MKLAELIAAANKAYPDGLIEQSFNPDTGKAKDGAGDTLALFIVRELSETFDPEASDEDQIKEAVRVLNTAINELSGVRDTFERR